MAVYGGRRDLMDWVSPLGPVYQAGTLSGNPVAVAAGIATLSQLRDKNPYKALDRLTGEFTKKMEDLALKNGIPIRVNRVGSAWTIFFTNAPVVDLVSVERSNAKLYAAFFHALLSKGVYLPPSAYETAFLSTTHSRALLSKTLKAMEYAFKQVPAG
jgi:glutamate-1-semialdehyde 2,1-aminomutase